jgi:transcriptional regulator with XRE-family HTH domain
MQRLAHRFLHPGSPADIVRAARNNLGLSQRYIAQRLGISQSRLSKIENKKIAVSAAFWFYFCNLLRLDCDCVIYGYCRELHLTRMACNDIRKEWAPEYGSSIGSTRRQT